jgi:hypothetical protein
MVGTDFASLVRKYTKTNSTVLADSEIVLLGNAVLPSLSAKISLSKEDAFEIPATRNLIEDQREYGFPADVLNGITRVEAKFSSTQEYFPLVEIDRNTYRDSDQESVITSHFSNEKGYAKYDLRRNSIFLYTGTIINVADGLKLYYNAFPQDLNTDALGSSSDLSTPESTTSVTIPLLFHEIWARKISIFWKSTREKPLPLNQLELKVDADFDELMSAYTQQNTDRKITAELADDTRLQGR